MPNDSREVRYFYMEDRATATELASKAGSALAALELRA